MLAAFANSHQRKNPFYPAALFALVLSLALVFFNSPGTSDVSIFIRWMTVVREQGLVNAYIQTIHASADRYPPLVFALLGAAGQAGQALGLGPFESYKLCLLVFLLLTSAAFYAVTRSLLWTASLQLVLTLDSIALGYMDILNAPFLILSFFALKRGRTAVALFLFSISFLIKFQPIILAPFLALYVLDINTWRDLPRINLRRALTALGALLLAPALLLLAFGPTLLFSLRNTMKGEFLSGYALNLNWLVTFLLHQVAPQTYGPIQNGEVALINNPGSTVLAFTYLSFLLVYGLIVLRFVTVHKTFANFLLYSLLGYLAYFILSADVHENHLFSACLLAALLAFERPQYALPLLYWALAANVNLLYFYGVEGQGLSYSLVVGGTEVSLLLSALNVVVFAAFLVETVFIREQAPALNVPRTPRLTLLPKTNLPRPRGE